MAQGMASWRHGARRAMSMVLLLLGLGGCGGGSSGAAPVTGGTSAPTRSFLMGASPFFATPTRFPDMRMEDMTDRDLLSLHLDDFWGVPWDYCSAQGCRNLPGEWVRQWQDLARTAQASGKPLYLALSPLSGRKTLSAGVLPNGSRGSEWAPVDASGCYAFGTDPQAQAYKTAYIAYAKYVIDLVGPRYLSPAVEMNIPFTSCANHKAAWVAWYGDVAQAIKDAYPNLVVFPTFQLDHMYGVADATSQCAGGITPEQCFDIRLAEALAIPADRMAISTYPAAWKYLRPAPPTDTWARIRQATGRGIWVSETGWPAVPVFSRYPHGSGEVCGPILLPDRIANEAEQAAYLGGLLEQAQAQRLEAVVWWLNRDYLDGQVAATCPCPQANSDTCTLLHTMYTAGGDVTETLTRVFGNMALRRYDGSARAAHAVWREWVGRGRAP